MRKLHTFTASGPDEIHRLNRLIKSLEKAHRKQLDGLLGVIRDNGRQIAELRIEAGGKKPAFDLAEIFPPEFVAAVKEDEAK